VPAKSFRTRSRRLVTELSGYPNRLLVTVTTEPGETFAEVAHETIFRRWDKLKEWIAAKREFLAWRSGLEAARRAWEKTPDRDKNGALLRAFALTQAEKMLAEHSRDGEARALTHRVRAAHRCVVELADNLITRRLGVGLDGCTLALVTNLTDAHEFRSQFGYYPLGRALAWAPSGHFWRSRTTKRPFPGLAEAR
jgi:hypothetical protein